MISFSLASELNESRFHLAVKIIDDLGRIHKAKRMDCLQNHSSHDDRRVSLHFPIKQC